MMKFFGLHFTLAFAFTCLLLLSPTTHAREYNTVIEAKDGIHETNGIITPLDQEMRNFYIRNNDGVIEVKLNKNVEIGLQTRMQRGGWEARKFIPEHHTEEEMVFQLPKEVWVKKYFKNMAEAKRAVATPDRGMRGGRVYVTDIGEHLPTENELWVSGKVTAFKGTSDKTFTAGGKSYQLSTKGHDNAEVVIGLMTIKDIKPFIQQAFVRGEMKGDVFYADELTLRPLADHRKKEDPKLKRYLFIGDSISGNYDRSLRAALKGKFNLVHPPTNCGDSGKGLANIGQWMGAYDKPGYGWDVISFNFGHWDSKRYKKDYQANLEGIIAELRKSKAKLIYVTTCPVPGNYPRGDKLTQDHAPGRTHGVMKHFINPWALEIIRRHPEISICDQHGLVTGEKFFGAWMKNAGSKDGRGNEYGDVHLGGLLGEPIGRQLARCVMDVMGRKDENLSPAAVTERDLDPKRQRPATKDLDSADYLDLLRSDKRLRQFNRLK
jgi:hypothetical protein